MFDVAGFFRLVSRSVRHHKSIVYTTTVATLVLVTIYLLVWPPVYRVEAKLAAERDLDPARDQFYSNWQVFRKDDPRDEIQLFTAGPVLRDVVAKNKLTYDDVYHPFLDHASYLWERSFPGRAYAAIKQAIVRDPDYESNKKEKDLGRIMDGLKAGVQIEPVGDTHIATLEMKGPNKRVADVANTLIDSYLAYRKERHGNEADAALKILNREAENARLELEKVRNKRDAFAHKNGLMIEFQKENLDIKELTGLETGIRNESSKLTGLEASLNTIKEQENAEKPVKVLTSTHEVNTVLESARQRRLELQTTLIGLRDHYREDSPEVQETLADLAKIDAIIAHEPKQIEHSVTEGVNTVREQLISNRDQLQSQADGTRAALTDMEEQAGTMRARLTQLPTIMSTAQDIMREYDVAAEKYKQLLFRKMEAEVSATALEAAPATVSVIDYAVPPTGKYWPKLKYLYPGALVAGLLLGVMAAVIRSLTSGRLLRDHLDRGRVVIPVYATIPTGGRTRVLTVLPRQSEHAHSSANAPREHDDNERSKQAGA
jgi:uncharacterized protein involved in exopolysaccharide biosynthesis